MIASATHFTPVCCFTISSALSTCSLPNTTTPCVLPLYICWVLLLYTVLLNTIMRIMILLHTYIMSCRYIMYIYNDTIGLVPMHAARFLCVQTDGAIVLAGEIMHLSKKSVLVADMSAVEFLLLVWGFPSLVTLKCNDDHSELEIELQRMCILLSTSRATPLHCTTRRYRNLCPGVRRAIVTPVMTPLRHIIKMLESLPRGPSNHWDPRHTGNLFSDLFQVVNLISNSLLAAWSVKFDRTFVPENSKL